MARPLVVEFTKMHGAGNDFIVVDNRFFHFSDAELARLAATWCPRRTGIGADGVLALAPPAEDGHDYRMRYVNADGSRARMCGNGARCLARFAYASGIERELLTFESDAGVYRAAIRGEDAVRLHVPPPRDYRPDEPLDGRDPDAEPVHYVWTGTEHAVCFVDDVDAVDVAARGAAIRNDPRFAPAGANANFVSVQAADDDASAADTDAPPRLRVRTFEKGVEAETQACGTGALAAAVVARHQARVTGAEVDVAMPGGTLRVGLRMEADQAVTDLYLEGPAVKVYRGTIDAPPDLLG